MDTQTAEVLKHVADKLDIPVEQLWNGLVAYAPFEFYQWVVTLTATIVFIPLGIAYIAWASKVSWQAPTLRTISAIFVAFSVAFSAISVPVMLSGTASALAAKHAPQAWAAKYIIQKAARR